MTMDTEHNPNDCPYCANSSRGITGVGVVFHDVAELKARALAAEAKLERVRALAEKYEEIRVHPEVNDLGHRTAADTARRLRECLGEKP